METAIANPPRHELIRAIGRWSLVALVVNSIIGSGIFGLPSTVAVPASLRNLQRRIGPRLHENRRHERTMQPFAIAWRV